MIAALLIAWSTGSLLQSQDPAERVREGLAHYEAARFEEADAAFAAAGELLPEESRIRFDRGCSLRALGKLEEAKQAFLDVAMVRQPELAASARYNLGMMAVESVKEILGEDPAGIEKDARDSVRAQIGEAIQRFQATLEVDAKHQDARYNLELLRTYLKQIEDLWKQKDAEEESESERELGALEMLMKLRKEQEGLRDRRDGLELTPAGPSRAQQARDSAEVQRGLQEKVDPLKEKLVAELSTPQGGGPGAPPAPQSDEELEAMKAAIDGLVQSLDDAGGAMFEAADALDEQRLPDAAQGQTRSAQSLESVFRRIAGFQALLSSAIETQKQVLTHTEARLGHTEAQTDGEAPEHRLQAPRAIERQDLVENWAALLKPHAEQGLAQLESTANTPLPPPDQGGPSEEEAVKMQEQQEALKRAFELALENGPRAAELAGLAETNLRQEDLELALPEEEEVLRLLEEIAKELPQDDESGQSGEEGSDSQDRESSEDQKDQQQDQDQQGDQEQDPSQQDEQEESQQDEQDQPEQPSQMDPMKAERLLQRAREREQEYEKMKERLRALLGRVPVKRDW